MENKITAVYPLLAGKDKHAIAMAGNVIRKEMSGMSAAQIIKFEETFRHSTSMEWTVDWSRINLKKIKKAFDSEEDYLWALKLGTFHPNGYFRESCLYNLKRTKESLPFILLRLNDWVLEVRSCAYELLLKRRCRYSLQEIIEALPYLYKAKKGKRRSENDIDAAEQFFLEQLNLYREAFPIEEICRYDYIVRKAVYRMLLEIIVLSEPELYGLMEREKNCFLKTLLLNGILKNYTLSLERLDFYIENKSAAVRKKAVMQKYNMLQSTWEVLEKLLLDKAYSIRDFSAFIYRRHSGFDMVKFYISRLGTEHTEQAILGIGENGTVREADHIYPYLKHTESRLVKAALQALSRLLKDRGEDIYWTYLFDERVPVSKGAYTAAKSNKVRYGAKCLYNEFIGAENEHVRRYLLCLLLEEDSWGRLPYLLYLYDYDNADLRHKIRSKIEKRNLYARLSQRDKEMIRNILDNQAEIPSKVRDGIMFDMEHI